MNHTREWYIAELHKLGIYRLHEVLLEDKSIPDWSIRQLYIWATNKLSTTSGLKSINPVHIDTTWYCTCGCRNDISETHCVSCLEERPYKEQMTNYSELEEKNE